MLQAVRNRSLGKRDGARPIALRERRLDVGDRLIQSVTKMRQVAGVRQYEYLVLLTLRKSKAMFALTEPSLGRVCN
jgi:hypothetical protein